MSHPSEVIFTPQWVLFACDRIGGSPEFPWPKLLTQSDAKEEEICNANSSPSSFRTCLTAISTGSTPKKEAPLPPLTGAPTRTPGGMGVGFPTSAAGLIRTCGDFHLTVTSFRSWYDGGKMPPLWRVSPKRPETGSTQRSALVSPR